MPSFTKYASVILEASIQKTLDYGIPEEFLEEIRLGLKVEVPLRGKLQKGYIFEIKENSSIPSVMAIKNVLTGSIESDLFQLGIFMARYYSCPLSRAFKSLLPAAIRKEAGHKEQLFVMRKKSKEELKVYAEKIRNKHAAQAEVLDVMLQVTKGILLTELLEKTKTSKSPVTSLEKKGYLVLEPIKINRSPLNNEDYFKTRHKKLNEEQAIALKKIHQSLNEEKFQTHLLYGVTGSGKTEVYLQAIEECLKLKKSAIMLVPEISLTEQTIQRFRSRFEGHIAILHHALSEGERFDEWHRIQKGDANIIIGARSAIFSPAKNLGLIIVDEEHENSYKQTDEAPCYHARDVAIMRGKICHATVILGSATPSLESFFNAKNQKYELSILTSRANSATLPHIHVVNMQEEFEKQGGYTHFSRKLLDGIQERMEKGEQTVLFLNRRGYHTHLFCESCQKPLKCLHCDTSLTFHKQENLLRCHICSYSLMPPPSICPTCKAPHPMKYKGAGTEQIEKALHAIFPEIKTIRLDRDTTKHKGSHQKLLRAFGSSKADVMIGTQMIAKGLHFESVTLVGVLNSDNSLNIPDFRASEHTFQLVTQVAGRAGRGDIKGEVIIQTKMPENSTIQLSQTQNYEKFYEEEIEIRKIFNYPPFSQMVKLIFSGSVEEKTKHAAESFRKKLLLNLPKTYEVYPVLPCSHTKIKDKFRCQFLIKGEKIYPVSHAIYGLLETVPTGIKLLADINPVSVF
ncbi:MAG TPA: primosomal protein N' [Parachlamydiaceae bacterium]|nr:primosomal protein N' [Parachlamydiaceae bacterium]